MPFYVAPEIQEISGAIKTSIRTFTVGNVAFHINTYTTGIYYLLISRRLSRSEIFNVCYFVILLKDQKCTGLGTALQLIRRAGSKGTRQKRTRHQVHHCSSLLKGALPFLLADPPLASAESAPTPGTSDFSDF